MAMSFRLPGASMTLRGHVFGAAGSLGRGRAGARLPRRNLPFAGLVVRDLRRRAIDGRTKSAAGRSRRAASGPLCAGWGWRGSLGRVWEVIGREAAEKRPSVTEWRPATEGADDARSQVHGLTLDIDGSPHRYASSDVGHRWGPHRYRSSNVGCRWGYPSMSNVGGWTCSLRGWT